MSLDDFMAHAISPWMRITAPYDDIVLSSRIRLARNIAKFTFPSLENDHDLLEVKSLVNKHFADHDFLDHGKLAYFDLDEFSEIEKRKLVEKHLISNHSVVTPQAAVLLSENEQISIMVNEEDHLRVQLYYPGMQLDQTLDNALQLDQLLEGKLPFAFDEHLGYLTSCPSNVGTGMRASVMMHLPALTHSKKMNKIVSIINQLGFVVRGFFGEGSHSLGHVYQVSNQVTLGVKEEDTINELEKIVMMLIKREKEEQTHIYQLSPIVVADKIFRSYGILKHSRVLSSQEAANRISDMKFGINIGLIKDFSNILLNELMIISQPGFLQSYIGKSLNENERDIIRAKIIRERFQLENK